MPPSTSTPNNRLKGLGIAVVSLSALLLLVLFALIWQSTSHMTWRSTPFMQTISGGVSSESIAVGIPAMMEDADAFGMDFAKRSEIAPMPPNLPGGAPPEDRARVGERVIRNGSLSLRVDDAEKRMEEARAIATAEGGFVADANVVNREGVRSAQITLRIPQDAFDRTLARLKELASTVFNESTNAEDVTAQFVDLEARLGAAKAEEAQYLSILQKADTIEDTLKVTARLGEVRARIESMEGQMRYLQDRTQYSTINVSMTEEARVQVPTSVWRPGETFRQSLRDLVVSLQGLVDVFIAFGVFLIGLALPVALLIALVAWIARAIWVKIRSK